MSAVITLIAGVKYSWDYDVDFLSLFSFSKSFSTPELDLLDSDIESQLLFSVNSSSLS